MCYYQHVNAIDHYTRIRHFINIKDASKVRYDLKNYLNRTTDDINCGLHQWDR